MIRKAVEADIPRLLELGKRMYEESQFAKFAEHNPEKAEAITRYCVVNEDCFAFVAEEEGEIVGYVSGGAAPNFLLDFMQSHEFTLFVAPEYRKTGTGAQLIQAYIDWALEYGVDEIMIDNSTLVDREGIGKLFRKMGFTPSGEIFHIVVNQQEK